MQQEIVVRLAVAAVLGGVVGLERERLEWGAGLRTHMLVCLGAALVMIVSAYGFADALTSAQIVLDPSRVAAQVVSGIGFLGAGTILFLRQEVIRGLTTAASLWTVAAIGLAVGGGLYLAAITATALVVVILALVKLVEKWLFRRDKVRQLVLLVEQGSVTLQMLDVQLQAEGLVIRDLSIKRSDAPGVDRIQVTLLWTTSRQSVLAATQRLQGLAGVREVRL